MTQDGYESLNVALVTPGFSAHPGDWAVPALQLLATGLATRHRVTVFSQRYPRRGFYQLGEVFHIAQGGGPRYGLASVETWLKTAWAIVQAHRRTPFDVVHAFWADEAGFAAALAAALIRRPLVVSLGGWELTNLPAIDYGAQRFWVRRQTVNLALSRASRITAGSQYQLDLGRAHRLNPAKLDLAPLGVDVTHFRPGHRIETLPGPPVIVQAASLVPVKNQMLLLAVFERVRAVLPDAHLHLAGSGPLEGPLRQFAVELQIEGAITWHQQLPHRRMIDLYHLGRVYLQTSFHESQGMAVLEALACGLPVVGTPVGVVPEVGCLPPQTDMELLAATVVKVLASRNRYRRWSEESRSLAETDYSLMAAVENFEAVYEACFI